jgi:hypothetical protein
MVNSHAASGENASILDALAAYHRAMVEAHTAELERLLETGYSLVHITGYVQPRQEWLQVIQVGEFDYHRVELDEESLDVSVTGITATVTGRGVFHATIQGMNAPWRLSFTLQYAKHGHAWLMSSARYTTF